MRLAKASLARWLKSYFATPRAIRTDVVLRTFGACAPVASKVCTVAARLARADCVTVSGLGASGAGASALPVLAALAALAARALVSRAALAAAALSALVTIAFCMMCSVVVLRGLIPAMLVHRMNENRAARGICNRITVDCKKKVAAWQERETARDMRARVGHGICRRSPEKPAR